MYRPGRNAITYVIAAVLIVFIFFMVKGCGKSGEKTYHFDKVTQGDVKKTIAVTGDISISDPVTVFSKISGIVIKKHIDYNQKVSKGQILMEIDSSAIDQRIQRMSGQLESARLELMSAKSDLEGKEILLKDNLISRRAFEQSEIHYRRVSINYNQIKSDYNLLRKDREDAKVYSPSSGIVINIYRDVDSSVGVNTPLVLLAKNLKEMILTISVDESDIGHIKEGQKVVFSVSAFPEKKFHGSINQIYMNPISSGGIVKYQSIVICDNEELLLKPGMTATATVVIDEKENVVRVLNQAFMITPDDEKVPEGGKRIVWVKSGPVGKPYKAAEVKTGLAGDLYTEIVSGVKEGEEVLIRIREK